MTITHYVLLAIVVLVALVAIAKWRQVRAAWQAAGRFLREVKVEMQKVSWPSRNDLIGSTIAVLTVVVVLTAVVTLADQLLSMVMNLLLSGRGV